MGRGVGAGSAARRTLIFYPETTIGWPINKQFNPISYTHLPIPHIVIFFPVISPVEQVQIEVVATPVISCFYSFGKLALNFQLKSSPFLLTYSLGEG